MPPQTKLPNTCTVQYPIPLCTPSTTLHWTTELCAQVECAQVKNWEIWRPKRALDFKRWTVFVVILLKNSIEIWPNVLWFLSCFCPFEPPIFIGRKFFFWFTLKLFGPHTKTWRSCLSWWHYQMTSCAQCKDDLRTTAPETSIVLTPDCGRKHPALSAKMKLLIISLQCKHFFQNVIAKRGILFDHFGNCELKVSGSAESLDFLCFFCASFTALQSLYLFTHNSVKQTNFRALVQRKYSPQQVYSNDV